MDAQLLSEKFERLGARLKVDAVAAQENRVSIDVDHDRKGEYFLVRLRRGDDRLRLDAIDVRPRERHLLLMAAAEAPTDRSLPKQKFLCGHDERAWFVAAVPERRRAVSDVRTAMEALKPRIVHESQTRHGVRFAERNRRKNAGFVRQGEWFFVPARQPLVNSQAVLRNEPLRRTGSKAHWAEFAYRTGGELIYFSPSRDRAIVAWQYQDRRSLFKGLDDWRPMRRNAQVLVTGRVSHPDHKTIHLRGWHWVVMNTEHESEAMRFVAFLD